MSRVSVVISRRIFCLVAKAIRQSRAREDSFHPFGEAAFALLGELPPVGAKHISHMACRGRATWATLHLETYGLGKATILHMERFCKWNIRKHSEILA